MKNKIKLPSNAVVSPSSLFEVVTAISKTGDTFTKEQLIAAGNLSLSADTVSRVLSYLKYLSIVDETRPRSPKDAPKEKNQKFVVIKTDPNVKELLYELKAARTDEAKEHWAKHIGSHQMFATLRDDFFGNDSVKTFIDLEHFLKDSDEANQNPTYYQNGSKFLAALLEDVKLIRVNGNSLEILVKQPVNTKVDENTKGATEIVPHVETESYYRKEEEVLNVATLLPEHPSFAFSLKGGPLNLSLNISKKKEYELAIKILENIESELSD